MSLCGLAIGWRIEDGFVNAVIGYLLLVAFAFAMIWVGGSWAAMPTVVRAMPTGIPPPLPSAVSRGSEQSS